MHIELTPHLSTMYLYVGPDAKDGYALRLPYEAILKVQWDSPTEVLLRDAHGNIDRKVWALAMEVLKAQGVKKVRFQRQRHRPMRTYNI